MTDPRRRSVGSDAIVREIQRHGRKAFAFPDRAACGDMLVKLARRGDRIVVMGARDDSLSKLAQQYLGDRFRFYILAKYNDISNPSRLAAGQVIKIPGRAPPPGAMPPPDATAKPAPDVAPPVSNDLATMMQRGRQQQSAGNVEAAYATFSDAVARYPGNRDAVQQRDGAKTALIRSYDREATQALQRQNLDLAISKWDRILELDPANQKAKLERERALDLKKRMSEKFGTTN